MEGTELCTRLMYTLHRIGKVHMKMVGNISKMEFFALEAIGKYQRDKEASGIYVSELAQGLRIAASQTSRMLKGLEGRGLIGRSVDGKDRRNTRVFLTEEGKEVCKEGKAEMDRLVERVIMAMGSERIEEMLALFGELADALEQETKGRREGKARS